MTNVISAKPTFFSLKAMMIVAGTFFVISQGVLTQTAHAATAENSGGTGTFTALELAKNTSIFFYAKPGEYIHFSVSPGERKGNAGDDCATVSIRTYQNTILTGGGSEVSTCNRGTPRSVDLVYRVPTDGSAINIDGPDKAYVAIFDTRANDDPSDPSSWDLIDAQDDSQGYEWHAWVSSDAPGNSQIHGRVWFDGSIGLKTWQNPASDENLTKNNRDFTFRYVRKDGYRYDMTYKDSQGIWSEFYGGIYGSALNDGANTPAYKSFYKYFDGKNLSNGLNLNGLTATNKAYVFIDCDKARPLDECPSEMRFFDASPITGTGVGVDTTGAANPIEKFDASRTSVDASAFRYTGYASGQLTGGRVYIPFSHMQSGLIRMQVWKGPKGTGTLLCQIDFRINAESAGGVAGPSADGNNAYSWAFTGARDASCEAGTLATAAASFTATDSVTFSAQAVHLGEMHFITADTERLGGVTVKGNGLSELRRRADGNITDTSTWIAWNDPFSRSTGDVCGTMPARVGDGGSINAPGGWDSVSSGRAQQPGGSIYTISLANRSAANSGTAADKWRLPTDSNVTAGVHGWIPASRGCNWTATSNANGTAATDSTWGNKRNIENWAFAYVDPAAKTFRIGGSGYDLVPNVTVSPQRVATNQSATFSYTVDNNRSASNLTAWSVRSVIILPGVTLPGDYFATFDGSGRTCASYYKAAGIVSNPALVTCNDVATEPGSSGSGRFPGDTIADQVIPQAYPVGTRICRALIVDSYNENSAPNPRSSALTCALVAVTPSVQIWGNDIRVGSGFVTGSGASASIKSYLTFADGNYRGSWSEYGALAPDSISNVGSGSGLNALNTASGNALDWSKLTFANNTIGTLGSFTGSDDLGQIPDVKGYMLNAATHAGLTLKQPGSSTSLGAYEANTVYIVGGTVTITSDIKNNSPRAGVNSLTQMVIIADAINIAPNVQQIDAWLITPGGTINTCVLPGADQRLSTSLCNAVLRINGPLMADKVIPRRTSGAGKDPAEIFNLRGDSYMWARKISEINGSIHTTYLTELPPRY